ncbi:MAG: peptidyl-prolyl cis-trans isomerase [Calditrichia bacterium]
MTKKYLIIPVVLISMILGLMGCHKDSVPFIEIVAKVGDNYLTRSELEKWMPPNVPEEQKEAVVRQYINRWVQRTTLALGARNDGISLTSYEKWSIENLEKEMLSQKYLETKLPKEIIVTDQEISNYYDENKDEFVRDEDEVHLVQLFLENPDQAIAGEIRESKLLLDVIQKNYLDSQMNRMMEKNGDIGYVEVRNLRPEIARRVKSGSTGRIYGPVRIESGYYYFQMLDKQKKGSVRSQDLVEDDIRLRLINAKKESLVEDIAKKMSEKYSVEIYPEHFK